MIFSYACLSIAKSNYIVDKHAIFLYLVIVSTVFYLDSVFYQIFFLINKHSNLRHIVDSVCCVVCELNK